MEFRIYKAKTVNAAITEACVDMGITSDMLEYEVVEEGSAGFMKLFSKDAVIKARKKEKNAEKPAEKE
ncbi:MAG: Jag N-terminal domain-containing protein, partial [Parasporobacterium sp.]|nr:Jag N-terminal domain-containing protein [Parasporobacterium sp.]